MQQIKCNLCQFTKFFVNSIGGASVISCSDCGASFVLANEAQQETPKEPVQSEPVEEPVNEFPEEPREIDIQKAEEPPKEPVQKPKALARSITPEEKQKMLLEMEKEGGE